MKKEDDELKRLLSGFKNPEVRDDLLDECKRHMDMDTVSYEMARMTDAQLAEAVTEHPLDYIKEMIAEYGQSPYMKPFADRLINALPKGLN